MNQKNIFTVISVLLILQGLVFLIMKSQIMTSAFPGVDATGQDALSHFMEVVAALSLLIGIVTYAARNSPGVVWAYCLGILPLLIITLKHRFSDHIHVPFPAMLVQLIIFLGCVYLWTQQRKAQ